MNEQLFHITDDEGKSLDATIEISGATIVMQSRGGTSGAPNARNRDYGAALRLILQRLIASHLEIVGAWVDSARVQYLPLAQRQILGSSDLPASSAALFSLMGRRMEAVGQSPRSTPSKGNRNKRIKIGLSGGSIGELAAVTGCIPKGNTPRHLLRLPTEDLRKVTPQAIWQAMSEIERKGPGSTFGPSRD